MEMYADRKGWDMGEVVVDVDYEPAQRGSPTRSTCSVQLPKELPEEQRERLMQIAAKCPVHRTLEGEVMFEESVDAQVARRRSHICTSPTAAKAEALVDRAAERRGNQRARLLAALGGVGQGVREQAPDRPRPRASGRTATHSMSVFALVIDRDQAADRPRHPSAPRTRLPNRR